MGCLESTFVSEDEPVPSESNYDRPCPKIAETGAVHMLIVALDYKKTANPLSCSVDARNMARLAAQCGVQDVVEMYDEECTAESVLAAIAEIGERCGEDDYFVLYYSGHGTSVEDEDGDEDDGMDEALCLVDSQGQISRETLLVDDDLAEALTSDIPEGARIIVLTDCCHSGTICDFDRDIWAGREAISIAGCLDAQTSGDIGRGGIFTHSMLLAVDQLEDAGEEDYSVGLLFNATLENDAKVFRSPQNITLKAPPHFAPDRMAWPLVPDGDYRAPLTQAAQRAAPLGGVADTSAGGLQMAMQNPQVLQSLGIQPSVVAAVSSSGLLAALTDDKINPLKLLKAAHKCYKVAGI